MTFLVDPIVVTPTGWLQTQAHVDRGPQAPIAAVTTSPPRQDWLTPLRLIVRLLRRCCLARSPLLLAVPLLAPVRWLRVRLTLYDRDIVFFPFVSFALPYISVEVF